MIVVAIVAILAAIVVPNYTQSVLRGRRSEAVESTASVQQAQERWRANNATYAANLVTNLGFSSTQSKSGYYQLAITNNTASGYTLTATAVAGRAQAGDTACTVMTLAVVNGVATSTPAVCWSR